MRVNGLPLLDSPDPKDPVGKASVTDSIVEGVMHMKCIFNLVKKFSSRVKTSITVKLPFVNVTLAPTIITSVFNREGGFFIAHLASPRCFFCDRSLI